MKTLLTVCLLILSFISLAQQKNQVAIELPYKQIPSYPSLYTPATVVARLIDGLGFRYYWATDSLRDEDLKYSPNNDSRTTRETLQHIYELTSIVVNSINEQPTEFGKEEPAMDFKTLRTTTLLNLKAASDTLKANPNVDIGKFKMIFKRGENSREFPFWNEINGPISDALWHVGQVVSFRRSSGNPFNSKVSVLTGTYQN